MWVATCDGAAPRASVDAYIFSHCANCHISPRVSYLSAPLAFSPDSLGCLGLPEPWRLFSGLAIVGASGPTSSLSFLLGFLGRRFSVDRHT